jgi:hypothetical protein
MATSNNTARIERKGIDARLKELKKAIGRRRRRRSEAKLIMRERYGGIEKIVLDQRGKVVHVTEKRSWSFADTAEGLRDLTFVLNCIAGADGDIGWNVAHYIAKHAPWMPAEEADALTAGICGNPERLNAEDAARLIGLTYDVRYRWKITTIGAIDVSPRRRRKLAEKRRQVWEQGRRHAAGATPRAESLERRAPWTGISSRATHFRRRLKWRQRSALIAIKLDGMRLFCDTRATSESRKTLPKR